SGCFHGHHQPQNKDCGSRRPSRVRVSDGLTGKRWRMLEDWFESAMDLPQDQQVKGEVCAGGAAAPYQERLASPQIRRFPSWVSPYSPPPEGVAATAAKGALARSGGSRKTG